MGKTVTEVVDVVDPLGNWSKAAAKLSVLAGKGGRRWREDARVAHINCCQCLNGNFLSFNARSPSLSLYGCLSWLVLALVMALFASARQTRSQTEGAGREKFAYQAALNINITRLRRGGDKYMRRGRRAAALSASSA